MTASYYDGPDVGVTGPTGPTGPTGSTGSIGNAGGISYTYNAVSGTTPAAGEISWEGGILYVNKSDAYGNDLTDLYDLILVAGSFIQIVQASVPSVILSGVIAAVTLIGDVYQITLMNVIGTFGSGLLFLAISPVGPTGLTGPTGPSGISLTTGFLAANAANSVPPGWLACDGSAINRITYANLFAAIGTRWGVGDNSTTFNLPDLRNAEPNVLVKWLIKI